ncbi:MAG TPA: hypothetical protein VFU71_01815 [Burkholderiaceae bacterium]|nr:hypothetical protein [Burkholderiaceae bacterium]
MQPRAPAGPQVALIGATVITLYRLLVTGFKAGTGLAGLGRGAFGVGLATGWMARRVAYVIGFFVMLAPLGWHPHPIHEREAGNGRHFTALMVRLARPKRVNRRFQRCRHASVARS